VDVVLLDVSDGSTHEVTTSVTSGRVTVWDRIEGVQPPIIFDEIFDEFVEAEEAIRGDAGFQAAMAKRGITDMSLVTVDPWSTGNYGDPLEQDCRLLRGLVWVHDKPGDNQYARPIDGLSIMVDLAAQKVLRIDDDRVFPLPAEDANWSRKFVDQPRAGVKPLQIIQPDGPSFVVTGDHISWQKWDLRVGWTTREGLVINTVTYTDGGEVRPVLYRASLAEMTVPYGDPSSTQARKNAFDVGEYGLGMLANSLKLGCD
jgi:primary-amine oxidase